MYSKIVALYCHYSYKNDFFAAHYNCRRAKRHSCLTRSFRSLVRPLGSRSGFACSSARQSLRFACSSVRQSLRFACSSSRQLLLLALAGQSLILLVEHLKQTNKISVFLHHQHVLNYILPLSAVF